jgi:small conductance mechanosensitive channel
MTVADPGYVYELLRKLGLSDFGARTGEFLLVRPLKVVLILAVAVVLARLASRSIRRFMHSVQARSPLRVGSVRAEQRAATLGDVLGGLARTLILSVAGLMVLGQLGVQLAPLIAGAGIAGVAIGFGAQSLVKDFFSGFFIIVEDQYGVGDVIDLGGGTIGTVEALTMRVTRARAADGTVWFVPNGEIRKIGNTSMEWSRALIDVLVLYDNDLTTVTALMGDEAKRFAEDVNWSSFVMEPPETLGVQALAPEGMTIRVSVKTPPADQYRVARELRGRILTRLRQGGVKLPGT